MTIEIDDAGTGDIIGDAFIAVWRRETNDVFVKKIPLELYQTPEFDSQSKEYVKDLIIKALQELNIPKTEEILMCRGNIFDRSRDYLKTNNYNVHDHKIEGFLQDFVEESYINNLIDEYDMPEDQIPLESGKDRFDALYEWLIDDYPRRISLIKTGFEKWRTDWDIRAKEDWMKQMVSLERNDIEEEEEEELEEETEKGTKQEKHYKKRGNHYHPRKQTSGRRPSFRNQSGGRQGSKGGNHKNEHRRNSGGRSDRRRSGPSNHHRDRDSKRQYSSTDPNPRRFLY